MSTPISETMIQFGSVDKRNFDKHGTAGALENFTVQFPVTFPKLNTLPSVIVTPSDHGLPRFSYNWNDLVPSVGIAVDVTTSGFTLSARNSAQRHGFVGFNWMAVLETPGSKQAPIDVRMGVTQPKQFPTSASPITSLGSGGPRDWYITYPGFHREETPFVTATNLYGTEIRNAAVVGMAIDQHLSGFWIIGENTDISDGDCAFYFVVLAEGEKGIGKEVWVEVGGTASMELAPSWQKDGSWKSEEVAFKDPFMTPPIVLVTAASPRSAKYRSVAALGIARYVTTHGFTLAARNTENISGLAWLSWVAFGCAQFCAWGNDSD
jgi:hypothetical protein